MRNIKAIEFTFQKLLTMLKLKNGQTPIQGQGHRVKKCWYLRKCLVKRNTHEILKL